MGLRHRLGAAHIIHEGRAGLRVTQRGDINILDRRCRRRGVNPLDDFADLGLKCVNLGGLAVTARRAKCFELAIAGY